MTRFSRSHLTGIIYAGKVGHCQRDVAKSRLLDMQIKNARWREEGPIEKEPRNCCSVMQCRQSVSVQSLIKDLHRINT